MMENIDILEEKYNAKRKIMYYALIVAIGAMVIAPLVIIGFDL